MKRKITLGALLAAFALSGYAVGQNNAQTDDVKKFEARLNAVQNDFSTGGDFNLEGAQKNSANIKDAVGNATLTEAFTQHAVSRSYSGADGSASVRLQALGIAQNQRIIELLEKLTAK